MNSFLSRSRKPWSIPCFFSMKAFRLLRFLALLLLFTQPSAYAQIAYVGETHGSVASGSVTGITFVGAGNDDSNNDNDVTPTLPGSTASGDLYICTVESHDAASHTAPAGWTNYYDRYDPTGSHHSSMWYLWRGASAASNPTFTHSGSSIIAQCVAFRGVDPVNPFDVPFVGLENPDGTTCSTSSFSPVTSGAMILFNVHLNDNPKSSKFVWPAGWSTAFYSTTKDGNDSGLGMAYQLMASPVVVGPVAATWAGDSGASSISTGALVALRPIAASGSSLTLSVPSGTASGNVMIASVTIRPSTSTVTSPAGWTLIRSTTQSSGDTGRLYTYWRAATAAEPASHTWTFSGTHTGAVGGITSFSGVDTATPVDIESGAATASSTTHSAPTVTTAYAPDMLVTTHAYFSSGTWTAGSSQTQAFSQYSAASAGSSGVSMAMAYKAQASAGATGVISATASTSADTGAAHIVALRKNVPLTCVSYAFDDASPLADWTLSKSGSSSLPSVVSGRLRLTSNSGNQAGAAHLTAKKFPGAGQKIVVEFDHFAYNGSGADGIAMTLSDASVTPAAGGYGGSLGYAQRTGVDGFAGGWIGIGIDEYGNYSNPTEGRTGTGTNSGFRVDSVAVRGSGSAATGYKFLAGSGTVSPGIDNSVSATASPGYRYRLTLDHSNASNAWTTVERDSGTGYQILISRFDPKADAAQVAVPSNWYLSFTGSTGGATNIHEIDNLQICAASITGSGPHHLEIQHGSGTGVTCAPSTLTIKACADTLSPCTAYTGGVSGTISATGTPTVNWTGGTSFTIASGSSTVTKDVQVSTAGTVVFGTSALTPAATSATTCNFGSPSCTFTSETAGFIFDVQNHVSDTLQTVNVSAVKQSDSSLACTPAFASVSKTVSFACAYANPATGTLPVAVNGTNISCGTPGNVTLAFGATGVASTTFRYADVGQINLTATYTGSGADAGLSMTGSDSFIAAPASFTVVPSGTYVAGSAFSAVVTAKNASGNTTPNFGKESTAESVTFSLGSRVAPSGTNDCTNGPCDGSVTGNVTLPWSGGAATASNVSYSEVGSMTLKATLTSGSYLGSGLTATGTSATTGNFIPAYFDTAVTAGCTGFTYSDQPFTVAVTAKNATGGTTMNYSSLTGCTVCSKDVTLSDPTATTNFNSTNSILAAAFAKGIGSSNAVKYKFPAVATAPATITLRAADSAGVTSNVSTGTYPTHVEGTTQVRSGRLRIANANGSELLALPVPAYIEYYKSAADAWQTNTLDTSCTTLAASDFAFSYPVNTANKLAACETAITITGSSPVPVLSLTKPGTGNDGWVDLTLNLGTSAAGNRCTAIGASGAASTTANRPWLQFNWSGATGNPTSRARFGTVKSGPTIHQRELF